MSSVIPDATALLSPNRLCGSLSEKAMQTTTLWMQHAKPATHFNLISHWFHLVGGSNSDTTWHSFQFSCLVGVTEMGNIVPRAGLKSTSLAFRASVPSHQVGPLMSPLSPLLPVYAAPYFRGQCRQHSSPWNCKSFNAYNYIHTGNDLTYTYKTGSSSLQHVACIGSWSRQSVWWMWWKWAILCLERESNSNLCHSGPVCCHYTM